MSIHYVPDTREHINRFPANRPFNWCNADKTNFFTNEHRTSLGVGGGLSDAFFTSSTPLEEGVEKRSPISLPVTTIRYMPVAFEYKKLDSGLKIITNGNEYSTIEIGNNWQTLGLVRRASEMLGLDVPLSYEELNETHFALAIFQNTLHLSRNSNRTQILSVHPEFMQVPTEHNFEAPRDINSSGFRMFYRPPTIGGWGEGGLGNLASSAADTARTLVLLNDFFSEAHIKIMVNEIAKMAGEGTDKDFLINILTQFGNAQKENFNRELEDSIIQGAMGKAKWFYEHMGPSDYDIENSPNFIEFKEAMIRLQEDMFIKALGVMLYGDTNNHPDFLWDGMWTDDRLFNIAGQVMTLRELDDRRTFLLTGSHRVSEDAPAASDSNQVVENQVSHHEENQVSFMERVKAMLLKRFSTHQNIRSAISAYEGFLGDS